MFSGILPASDSTVLLEYVSICFLDADFFQHGKEIDKRKSHEPMP